MLEKKLLAYNIRLYKWRQRNTKCCIVAQNSKILKVTPVKPSIWILETFFSLTKCVFFVFHINNVWKFSEYFCREVKLNNIDNRKILLSPCRCVSSSEFIKARDNKQMPNDEFLHEIQNVFNTIVWKSLFGW